MQREYLKKYTCMHTQIRPFAFIVWWLLTDVISVMKVINYTSTLSTNITINCMLCYVINVPSFYLSCRELIIHKIRLQERQKKSVLCWIKIFIPIILFLIVLGSTTLNRLALASMIGKSKSVILHFNSLRNYKITPKDCQVAVTLYWYLQFTLLIPNFITFLWCLVVQVSGKKTVSYPQPTAEALIIVSPQA